MRGSYHSARLLVDEPAVVRDLDIQEDGVLVVPALAAPASAAGGCASLYVNVNGQELVNQTICTP